MASPKPHSTHNPVKFLTGATGFLGSHICYALLEAGHHVVALTRASRNQKADERVVEVLSRIAASEEAARSLAARLEVVEGDIAAERLGLDHETYRGLTERVDETWHIAASLSFLEEDREDIFRMNLDGTSRVVEFVSGPTSRRLQHVSTAYVAGTRTGVVLEEELDVGQDFRNPYEESKCRAELLIAAAAAEGRIVPTVYRPSIVIGESRSGKATHFHGVYAFIRGLWAVVERLRRKSPDGGIVQLPLRVLGSLTTTLNFVPIDYVTDGMVEIGKRPDSVGRTFHMANPEATPNALWLGIVCAQLGVEGIRFVENSSFEVEPMTRMEALFHRQMAFYNQYLQGEPRFDCSNALGALEGTSVRCPGVSDEFARKMTGWYIDRLNEKRG